MKIRPAYFMALFLLLNFSPTYIWADCIPGFGNPLCQCTDALDGELCDPSLPSTDPHYDPYCACEDVTSGGGSSSNAPGLIPCTTTNCSSVNPSCNLNGAGDQCVFSVNVTKQSSQYQANFGCDVLSGENCCTPGSPGCDINTGCPIVGSQLNCNLMHTTAWNPNVPSYRYFAGKIVPVGLAWTYNNPCPLGYVSNHQGACVTDPTTCDPTNPSSCSDPCQTCQPSFDNSGSASSALAPMTQTCGLKSMVILAGGHVINYKCQANYTKTECLCHPNPCGEDPNYPGDSPSCFDCTIAGSGTGSSMVNSLMGQSPAYVCTHNNSRCPPPQPQVLSCPVNPTSSNP